ncbi:MAG: GMC family oxidoreductase [Gammaproteobacteria bacterium]|nr:GMC family oxidoreductase [Gammaproteobacteria bacterium]
MNTDFDAIVVGSGISGGWAAKELSEKGLKVLVLERGAPLTHGEDYVGEHRAPWETPLRGKPLRELYKSDYAVQSTSFAFGENNRPFWNNDRENPYVMDGESPFLWMRGAVVGGKSLMWSRQVYRWSDMDFGANARDGHGIDWPLRYADIAPWYAHVERLIGVSGAAEDIPHLPDGEFLPAMDMNAGEKHLKREVEQKFAGRRVIMGRAAVLTREHNGRGACHYCGPCERGCSVGAYFSSLSSTLPAAAKTGRLTLRANSVVEGLDYDPATRKVSAVRVIDSTSGERLRFSSRLVFLCASTVGSTQILLNSRSDSFPEGLANGSGTLGRYLMDHTNGLGAFGLFPNLLMDRYYSGNRPNNIYIPRFRNLGAGGDAAEFVRGYGFQGAAFRTNWSMNYRMPGFGAGFKQTLRYPGYWAMFLAGFGECLPQQRNRMYLHPNKVDRFGIPQVAFDFAWHDNEKRMCRDIVNEAEAMLRAAGAQIVMRLEEPEPPGGAIHEMGSARMGRDPAQSVLNGWNQAHEVENLFVTDGAAMSSTACVNPSLTYMALTARACDYAVARLRSA